MEQTRLKSASSQLCYEGSLKYVDNKLQILYDTDFYAARRFLRFIKRVKGNYYYLYSFKKWNDMYIEPVIKKPYYEHKNKPCTKSKNMV